ncbi:MAG: T9SS type A sorting domain-containing protein [Crocinitomicaceae bacterium]
MKLNRLLGLGIVACGFSSLQAQEATVASGGEATGSGGSVSYTVGQVSYLTNSGSAGTIGEGVQQPYEILTLDVKENYQNFSIVLFPNPTRENLNLNVGELDLSGLEFLVYDAQGKLIDENKIKEVETKISLGDHPPGNYFLNVMKDNQPVKSFKVIKN